MAADNVMYLELRTTPRGHPATGMTASSYVAAVIRGIQQAEMAGIPVVTRLLLSINRTEPVYVATRSCCEPWRRSHLDARLVWWQREGTRHSRHGGTTEQDMPLHRRCGGVRQPGGTC